MTYLCIGPLLVILMNPGEDRASVDLHRVFFASSHGVVAIMFGMGLSLIAAYMATHYQRFRQWYGLIGGCFAVGGRIYARLLEAVGRSITSESMAVQINLIELPQMDQAKAFAAQINMGCRSSAR